MAIPERWPRKLSAVRSAVTSDRRGPERCRRPAPGSSGPPSADRSSRDLHRRIDLGVGLLGATGACEPAVAARHEPGRGLRPGRKQRRGQVAEWKEVLGEGPRHRVAHRDRRRMEPLVVGHPPSLAHRGRATPSGRAVVALAPGGDVGTDVVSGGAHGIGSSSVEDSTAGVGNVLETELLDLVARHVQRPGSRRLTRPRCPSSSVGSSPASGSVVTASILHGAAGTPRGLHQSADRPALTGGTRAYTGSSRTRTVR